MVTFNRRQTIGLIGAAAATGLAAPAIAQGKKIVVGALRFTSHSASFIAAERKYFADAGLDVELRFFQAAQPMAVAIASGDVDYAVTAISGGLISLADKGAIKVIGGALSEEPGIDGQKILASDAAFKAGLTSPAALGGKKFGISTAGSSFHYMGSKVAQAEGVDVSFTPLQKVGAIIGALKSGQIDAWSIVPHIAKPLAGSGAVHIIGSVSDNERSQTAAFISAFGKGASDYNSTMIDKSGGDDGVNEMVDLIHKYVYTDRPREKAAPSIINGTMRINEGARLNVASVQDQLSWFQSEGLIDADITLDTFVDTSYVETFEA
jgi:NitT/TauT family transport system substrate-binding protein